MLIESLTVNAGNDHAVDPAKLTQWQSELDQFVATTKARLDALSISIAQCATEPVPTSTGVDHAELPPPVESTAPAETNTERPMPLDTEPVIDESIQPHVLSGIDPTPSPEPIESPIDEPIEAPVALGDSIDPDEAFARLSAIKSRLAKQLEGS